MLFDTDILIWVQRGNLKAARLIDSIEEKYISIQTYMELLQGAKNKKSHNYIKDFLTSYNFIILPLTDKIGHRAAIYIEEYTIVSNFMAADAIIAATATENNMVLVSGNAKHFKVIKDLQLKVFRP